MLSRVCARELRAERRVELTEADHHTDRDTSIVEQRWQLHCLAIDPTLSEAVRMRVRSRQELVWNKTLWTISGLSPHGKIRRAGRDYLKVSQACFRSQAFAGIRMAFKHSLGEVRLLDMDMASLGNILRLAAWGSSPTEVRPSLNGRL